MIKSKTASAPYLVWMGIFIIVPMILVGYFAFTDPHGAFTLKNLTEVGQYSNVFLRSIWLGLIATVISLLMGYPLAYLISRTGPHRQAILIMLIMLPMWMNFLLRTYAWMTLLEDSGIINTFLVSIGLGRLHLINTAGAVVLGMVYNYIPYMILPIYSVLTKIDQSVIEAAQDLGAGRRKVFLKVTLPMSMPGVISGVTMVFVPSVSTFIISKMLGGGGNLLIGDLIDMQFLGSAYNPNLGSAISLVLMVLILICMGIMNQFDEGGSEDGGGDADMTKTVSRLYMALVYLFLYAPIFILIIFSFNDSSTMSRSLWSGFSLRWYRQLFQDRLIMEALQNTLIIALISSLGATAIGTAAAIGINGMKRFTRKAVMNITNFPMVNPEIVTGVSLMLLFVFFARAMGGVSLGMVSLILAHVTFSLPYVILSVLPKLRQMDPHLYEAAQDLGCPPVKSFLKVVLPEIIPGVVTGMIMAFTLSIDDFVISYFTSGTTQTLPIYIYSMTRKRISPEINALSTLLFGTILVLLLIVNVRRSKDKQQEAEREEA